MIGDKLLHAKLHDVAEEVKSLEYRQIYLDALVKEARDTIAMFPNTLMLVALGTRLKEYDEHCAKATAHRSA